MKKLNLIIYLILCLMILCSCQKNTINNQESSKENIKENESMEEFTNKINITINNTTYTTTLEDNETSRELIKRLPLNISMTELNGNEKYYYFDSSLPSNSSKIGKINSGDILLYGSDCFVLFYDTFNTSYSYTRIGSLDNPTDLKNVVGKGDIEIYISK